MYLIVGLGNPGRSYIDSRHNIGFSVLRNLAKNWKVLFKRDPRVSALAAKVRVRGRYVLLAMPLTFMNLSGIAVAELVNRYDIDLARLLVVCDDLDLELGRLKIKPSGSSGGHRGLKSIIDSLETNDFSRLRIGIGQPPLGHQASDYVLSGFTKQEKIRAREVTNKAVDCCWLWLTEGMDEAMNIFNIRK